MDVEMIALYLGIGLVAVELAKRVAEVIPGKKDDEIVSMIDGLLRSIVDFIAGRNLGASNDPAARKK
jgi:hypothetical protein